MRANRIYPNEEQEISKSIDECIEIPAGFPSVH